MKLFAYIPLPLILQVHNKFGTMRNNNNNDEDASSESGGGANFNYSERFNDPQADARESEDQGTGWGIKFTALKRLTTLTLKASTNLNKA